MTDFKAPQTLLPVIFLGVSNLANAITIIRNVISSIPENIREMTSLFDQS
jgi:ABC-type glycerol-3-phosphate transport system permease component